MFENDEIALRKSFYDVDLHYVNEGKDYVMVPNKKMGVIQLATVSIMLVSVVGGLVTIIWWMMKKI